MFAPSPHLPSPLEGEGAQRADEGSANSTRVRNMWRSSDTSRLRKFAKQMRHEPTEAEAKLWGILRNRRLASYKFRRQLPIGQYIVDFVCLNAKLIIELDGSQHAENPYDLARDAYLRQQGFRLLRIWNNELLATPDAVLDAIWHALQEQPA